MRREITLINFLYRFNVNLENRMMFRLIGIREIADMDKNPENREKPILGANDGGSGVSILMVL